MDLTEIFKKMSLIRHFELQAAEAVKNGFIKIPVYLSVGQEAISAAISTLTKGFSVFAQHRAHSVYLAYGGDTRRLIDELLGRETGCNRGRGGSPCIQDLDIKMFGHHGLIGENIPLAVGYALATGEKTVVYFGDAAAEEDYALTSMGFAATHKLPVLFVCENNDLSILTPISARRSWKISDAAASFGLKTAAIDDDPEIIIETVKSLLDNLPAFVDIKTTRYFWHAGIGVDKEPERDRLNELKGKIVGFDKIEEEIKNNIKKTWQEQLRTQ